MRTRYTWALPRTSIELGDRTVVMGILNVTPDSFSDGGAYLDRENAVGRALELEAEGADILDVGGESSRPGSTAISEQEELQRVVPVVEALSGKLAIPISVDTYRSEVARCCIAAGAQIVNDISAFRFDPKMAAVVSAHKSGVVLMHSRGNRDELHTQPPLTGGVEQVARELGSAVQCAIDAGIGRSAIVVDPGIGFGKRAEESLNVLRNLKAFSPLECALLVGTSRKSFIRRITQSASYDPLWGTAATIAASVMGGAHIVRVHDVREVRALVDVLDAIIE